MQQRGNRAGGRLIVSLLFYNWPASEFVKFPANSQYSKGWNKN
jgi:hypothetical protein